jgi:hypothetical protein
MHLLTRTVNLLLASSNRVLPSILSTVMRSKEAFVPENGKGDYLEDDLEEDAGRLIIYTIDYKTLFYFSITVPSQS